MTYKKQHKQANVLNCIFCNFTTSKKCNYNNHLLTAKHTKLTNIDKNQQKEATTSYVKKYGCECGKTYLQRQSLFTHKKKCIFLQKEFFEENPILADSSKLDVNTNVILDIIKENQEFKTLLIEQQNQVIALQKENHILMNKMLEHPSTITKNSNITNNNNQYNLNLFLNETCKNALNFSDFIDNIQVTDDDLENNVKLGFVDGVSKLIMNHLKQLALSDRPIHCTDVKRETIYVKEEDQWEKDHSKEVIQKGIQEITRKNMRQLSEWREENPEYEDMETEKGEKSIAMQQSSMAGGKREEFYNKIIKNMAKKTIIDKKKMIE